MAGVRKWTHEENMLLIECYRKFESLHADGKLTLDQFWKKVADELMFTNPEIFIEDRKVVTKKCTLQMTFLKKKYKDVLKANKKSGNARACWEYFESMHEIFHKKPWVVPLSVAGSDVPFKGLLSNEQKKKRSIQKSMSEFERKKIELAEMRFTLQKREYEETKAHEDEKVLLLKDVINFKKNKIHD